MQQPRFPPPQRPTPPPPGGVGLRGRPPPPPVPTKSAPAAPSTGTAGAAPAAAVPQATAGGALLRGPGTGAPLPPHFAAIRELVQSEQHYVTVLRVFLSVRSLHRPLASLRFSSSLFVFANKQLHKNNVERHKKKAAFLVLTKTYVV